MLEQCVQGGDSITNMPM